MDKYLKFKTLLEYFVSHLNFVRNKDTTSGGYLQYIKPLIDEGVFKYTGQGYAGANIQNQIKAFDVFEGDQVFINIQQNYGDYRSSKSYLNWAGTGINIIAIWKGDTLHSLGQEEYLYWEDNPSRKSLEINKTLTELGLFTDTLNNDLINFYDNYRNILLRYKANEQSKKMKPIIDLLEYKKQIILQGPPGTGKTRYAKILADELTKNQKTKEKVETITKTDILNFLKKDLVVDSVTKYNQYKIENIENEKVELSGKNIVPKAISFNTIIESYSEKQWEPKKIKNGLDTYEAALAFYIYNKINSVAKNKIDKDEYVKLIQFHPSYTYEDFVRGIVAKPNESGDGIVYEAENKTLAKFAKQALDNFIDHNKDPKTLSKENKLKQYLDLFKEHINDEIENNDVFFPLTDKVGLILTDDDEAFRYKGQSEGWSKNGNRMLFKDIIQLYLDVDKISKNNNNVSEFAKRQDIKNNNNVSGLARQHASYFVRVLNLFHDYLKVQNLLVGSEEDARYVELKKYVLIIDEINRANLSSVLGELIYALEYREEEVESLYAIDGDAGLILPPNLYIIGTMNTADRSVGHIDYAIRRRFAFVDVLPIDLSKDLEGKFDKKLFDNVSQLFDNNLSPEFSKEEVQIGHSYFIDKSEEGGNMEIRLEYEIKPILREYVKDGVLIGNDIEDKIKNLKSFI